MTQDPNYSTGASIKTSVFANYSIGARLQTTQDANYFTEAFIKLLMILITLLEPQ